LVRDGPQSVGTDSSSTSVGVRPPTTIFFVETTRAPGLRNEPSLREVCLSAALPKKAICRAEDLGGRIDLAIDDRG
jgi:hypothetical protein